MDQSEASIHLPLGQQPVHHQGRLLALRHHAGLGQDLLTRLLVSKSNNVPKENKKEQEPYKILQIAATVQFAVPYSLLSGSSNEK